MKDREHVGSASVGSFKIPADIVLTGDPVTGWYDLVVGTQGCQVQVGLATEFRSEKIPRNRFGTANVIPRKKVLIPRHSELYGRVYSEARNGRKWQLVLQKILL